MIYGYARVSTARQADGNSLEVQRQQLTEAGAEVIVADVFTGTSADRPELCRLMDTLEPGDILMATKIDRLGRSVRQVTEFIDTLHTRGIGVHILNLGLLDDTPTGKLMRNVLLAIAEFERDMIVERTQEGRELARQNAEYRDGRRPKFTRAQLDHAMDLLTCHTYRDTVRMTGISRATLAREAARRRAAQTQ